MSDKARGQMPGVRNTKPKFDYSVAHMVATRIVEALEPYCERVTIAGSLRRCEKTVGDIEILYIPKFGRGIPAGSLFEEAIDLSLFQIRHLIETGVLAKRTKAETGQVTFGKLNKLMRHLPSGLPVDLFATDASSWFNYMVCRTGPAAFNIRLAQRARELGWQWHPYGCGFSKMGTPGEWQVIRSEEQLFQFLGWSYLQPWERNTRSSEEKTGVEGSASLRAGPATQKAKPTEGGALHLRSCGAEETFQARSEL